MNAFLSCRHRVALRPPTASRLWMALSQQGQRPQRAAAGRALSDTSKSRGSSSGILAPFTALKQVWSDLTSKEDIQDETMRKQERKDLYYVLLVSKLREYRLKNQEASQMEIFDEAFADFQKFGLDDMSNIELRGLLQDSLGPQVMDLFATFESVDKHLEVEVLMEQQDDDYEWDQYDHDYDTYKSVLMEEYDETCSSLENLKMSPDLTEPDANSIKCIRSIGFLERKVGALRSILEFHGWQQLQADNAAALVDWTESFPTDPDDEMDDFGFRVTSADEQTFAAIRHYQTINMFRSTLIRRELGYSVIALKSLLPRAGRGVFVDGTATAGSLMSFQPGQVWPLGSIRPDVEDHFRRNDNFQISMRYDKFIVDSRNSPYTVLTRKNSNPFAVGHILNHPAPTSLPNCQSCMLNFVESMQLGPLSKYIPNTYAVPPAWVTRTFDRYTVDMHGLAVTARRDVQDEELFYDYRLDAGGLPSWYHAVIYPIDDA